MTKPKRDKPAFNFNEITRSFNPAWFAAVMGTAVVPLAVSFSSQAFKPVVATFFFILSAILFLLILVPWTLKFFKFPESIKKDLNHPIAGSFFPTMPISLIIISLDLMKYPELFFTRDTSLRIAFYLWLIGSIGIYLMGFIILIYIFRHKEVTLSHANFGWYIPPVSKLIIPVAGFELAGIFPQSMELTFGLSIISLGVGFFLFLFVGATVYHRYIYHELPMSRFAATFFIGIAPTAIIAVIFFKMINLFEQVQILGVDPHIFIPIAKLAIMASWGFSMWWFFMSLIVVGYYMRKMELPYALSWWAFTFPTGALCIASGVAWKVSNFASIGFIYNFGLFFLLAVWLLVFIRTLRGVVSGEIFVPAH